MTTTTTTTALVEALTPTLHLNGSGGEALARALRDAAEALYAAERRVREAAPNGRDYYVRGPEAPIAADAAYRALARDLSKVTTVITEVYLAVEDQLAARQHAPVGAPVGRCACGEWSGVRCEARVARLVRARVIPEQHRGTAETLGASAQLPMGLGEVLHVHPECAEHMAKTEPQWVKVLDEVVPEVAP